MVAKLLASAGIALALGACALEPIVTKNFVDYNRIAADSGNSVLLLNILRAKDRMPLHLTAISQLNPGVNNTTTVSGTVGFDPIRYTTLTLTPSTQFTSKNEATLWVENTKKFMSGFLLPIKPELFDYFWAQGWPTDLLIHLFVSKIEVFPTNEETIRQIAAGRIRSDQRRPVYIYLNSPTLRDSRGTAQCGDAPIPHSWDHFTCFQDLVLLLRPFLRFSNREAPTKVGPPIPIAKLQDVKDLIEVAKASLKLVATNPRATHFQLTKAGSAKGLCIAEEENRPGNLRTLRSSEFTCPDSAGLPRGPRTLPRESALLTSKTIASFESAISDIDDERLKNRLRSFIAGLGGHCRVECQINFHLRSPEQMLYYLGEVARIQIDSRGERTVDVFRGHGQRPLLQLIVGPEALAADISVAYDGTVYGIKKTGSHQSMQALTLITFILGLQREADELPRTSVVTVQ